MLVIRGAYIRGGLIVGGGLYAGFYGMLIDCIKYRYFQIFQIMQTESPSP